MSSPCPRLAGAALLVGIALDFTRASAAAPTDAGADAGELGVEAPAPKVTEESAGLAPTLPSYEHEVDTTAIRAGAAPTTTVGGYTLRFHGFMRAPLRIGVGPRHDGAPGDEWHSPPRIPDGSFTWWQYLDNVPGPWAELMFTYGNDRAAMTVSLAGYNQTVAGYRELQAQLGINQAFLTLKFPDVFGRYGGLVWNVGSFTSRYGTSGKYDAGMYETYLFGRTRAAGQTLTASLHLTPSVELIVEHGIGAKLDVIPFSSPMPRPEYLPYAGPEPQGSTFLHHAHASLRLRKLVTIGGHWLHSWSTDDRGSPDVMSRAGKMTVSGGELRLSGDVWGDGYVGVSRVDAENVRVVADAIEVLHSLGGWQFKNNYFGRYGQVPNAGDVSGRVDTLLFQYAVSIGKIARHPVRFWGRGPDLVVTVFGMLNKVTSDNNSHDKLKVGGDVVYTPLPVLGFGLRYDLVRPDSRNPEQAFAVVSPRLLLRTQFLSHERVVVQYSRYWNGSAVRASFPYDDLRPDGHVFMIAGSMWW